MMRQFNPTEAAAWLSDCLNTLMEHSYNKGHDDGQYFSKQEMQKLSEFHREHERLMEQRHNAEIKALSQPELDTE